MKITEEMDSHQKIKTKWLQKQEQNKKAETIKGNI